MLGTIVAKLAEDVHGVLGRSKIGHFAFAQDDDAVKQVKNLEAGLVH